MQDLLWLARRSSASTEVDRLDRAAERVLLELMLSIAAKPRDDAASGVESIQRYVEKNLGKDHDFEALARRHGLSPTTFRRRWHAHVGCPPARHVAILRLQAASRALIETDASIARIARQLGFGSATSFCRRFRRYAGMSASSYRREHGMPTRS
jgi:transcriptional regulator GlxA family with amidase domain